MASSKKTLFEKDGLRVVLNSICRNLDEQDERGMKFLLRGKLDKNDLKMPLRDVFKRLEEERIIKQKKIPWTIIDCLQFIGQIRLIMTCFGEKCMGEHHKERSRINPYRRMLYNTGMALTSEEWKTLMFLFGEDIIPKSIQESFESALDLFLHLEEKNVISKRDTKELKGMLKFLERQDLILKLESLTFSDCQSTSNSDEDAETVVKVPPYRGRKRKHPALSQKYSIILEKSVIKGIHEYKVNPPVERQLSVIHEVDNEYDDNACIVSLPDSSRRKCFVEDGKVRITETSSIVGHVPWGLSRAIRYALDRDCGVIAVKTGRPRPSFDPCSAEVVDLFCLAIIYSIAMTMIGKLIR